MNDGVWLERLVRLGLPVTTLGAAFLYLIGVAYHVGIFAAYGCGSFEVHPDWQDAVSINKYSLILVYHVVIGYAAAAYFLTRGEARGEEGRWDGRITKGLSLLSALALVLWFLPTGHYFEAVTLFGGGLLGAVMASIQLVTRVYLKLSLYGLGAIVILVHAHAAGRLSPGPRTPMVVRTKTGEIVAPCLYRSDDGLYLLPEVSAGAPKQILFVPSAQIESWRIAPSDSG